MPRPAGRLRRKSIYDPIHGTVTLEGPMLDLIAQPAFQRLWGIRQTGFVHLVFPGANHTRLEHSLGTSWVANQMAGRLGLDPERTARVVAGALLHDLGHGPFSHSLDGPMVEVLGHGHEAVSRQWIEAGGPVDSPWRSDDGRTIPELLEAAGLSPSGVADLVDPGEDSSAESIHRAILHSAIDADRLDYLQRDAHYTGVGHGAIDAARLLETVQADHGRMVFAEKGRSAVEGFLVGRSLMYTSVYYHKTVRAAEVMVQAAVERMAGYPSACRRLLYGTDAELLSTLHVSGPASERLVRQLELRRLHKRAAVIRRLTGSARRAFERLARQPESRRSAEELIAHRLNAPPGGVLFDLAGLRAHDDIGEEWARVGVVEEDRVTYPFRGGGLWTALVDRPPTSFPVSVYVDARFRAVASRRLPGLLRSVL